MKQFIEVNNEGFELLIGENVTLFCMNYIYKGKLVGVNEKFVKLDDAYVVYETGSFSEPTWKDAQKLPESLYIMVQSVESFTILRKK